MGISNTDIYIYHMFSVLFLKNVVTLFFYFLIAYLLENTCI